MYYLKIIIFSIISVSHSSPLMGLDVFQEKNFQLIQGKNVGLVINHTSLNKDGKHILDLLLSYEQINIKSIFTPEHGLQGNVAAGEKISDTFSKEFDIQIISLYGKKKEPELNEIKDLDYIIFDIQDVGSRYYTYISTLTYILNAASKAHIPIIILDRPNPLGRKTEGPIIDLQYYFFKYKHSAW